MGKSDLVIVTFRLPRKDVDKIEELIISGRFSSRSSFCVWACKSKLRDYAKRLVTNKVKSTMDKLRRKK